MKPALFLATALLMAAAGPTMADNGQVLDLNAHQHAYPGPERLDQKQCFNGKFIAGISRNGERTVYVQAATGGIYRLEMKDSCDALKAATKVTAKVYGNDIVCANAGARIIAHTPAGETSCKVAQVSHLSPRDVAELSASNRR
jgi:hypothetical protein